MRAIIRAVMRAVMDYDYIILGLSCSFNIAVAVGISASLIFSEGLANFNKYGEGWLEVATPMILGILGVYILKNYDL